MRLLYEDEALCLQMDEEAGYATIERRRAPINSTEGSIAAINAAADRLPTHRLGLLVDLRRAVGRNDPEFEQRIVPAFNKFTMRFGRIAILVATQAGRLQLARLMRGQTPEPHVFVDEEEARRFASGGVAARG